MAKRRTVRQRAASKRNLVKARAKRKGGRGRKAMKYTAIGAIGVGAVAYRSNKRYLTYNSRLQNAGFGPQPYSRRTHYQIRRSVIKDDIRYKNPFHFEGGAHDDTRDRQFHATRKSFFIKGKKRYVAGSYRGFPRSYR